MKRVLTFTLAAALGALAAAPTVSQTMNPVPVIAPGNALLTVSAERRTLREPDVAVFSAGVTTQGKTAGEALAENSRPMTRPSGKLKELNECSAMQHDP